MTPSFGLNRSFLKFNSLKFFPQTPITPSNWLYPFSVYQSNSFTKLLYSIMKKVQILLTSALLFLFAAAVSAQTGTGAGGTKPTGTSGGTTTTSPTGGHTDPAKPAPDPTQVGGGSTTNMPSDAGISDADMRALEQACKLANDVKNKPSLFSKVPYNKLAKAVGAKGANRTALYGICDLYKRAQADRHLSASDMSYFNRVKAGL